MFEFPSPKDAKKAGFHTPRPFPAKWSREAWHGHFSRNTWAAELWLENGFSREEEKRFNSQKSQIWNPADLAQRLFFRLISRHGASAFSRLPFEYDMVRNQHGEIVGYVKAGTGGAGSVRTCQHIYTATPPVWEELKRFAVTWGFVRGMNSGEEFERVVNLELDLVVSYLIETCLAQPLEIPSHGAMLNEPDCPVCHIVSTDGATDEEVREFIASLYDAGFDCVGIVLDRGTLYQNGDVSLLLKSKTQAEDLTQ